MDGGDNLGKAKNPAGYTGRESKAIRKRTCSEGPGRRLVWSLCVRGGVWLTDRDVHVQPPRSGDWLPLSKKPSEGPSGCGGTSSPGSRRHGSAEDRKEGRANGTHRHTGIGRRAATVEPATSRLQSSMAQRRLTSGEDGGDPVVILCSLKPENRWAAPAASYRSKRLARESPAIRKQAADIARGPRLPSMHLVTHADTPPPRPPLAGSLSALALGRGAGGRTAV